MTKGQLLAYSMAKMIHSWKPFSVEIQPVTSVLRKVGLLDPSWEKYWNTEAEKLHLDLLQSCIWAGNLYSMPLPALVFSFSLFNTMHATQLRSNRIWEKAVKHPAEHGQSWASPKHFAYKGIFEEYSFNWFLIKQKETFLINVLKSLYKNKAGLLGRNQVGSPQALYHIIWVIQEA